MSWQAQHFVDLHVQISWQAQHCVNLEVQTCEPPCAESTALVKLEVQISWQAQYKIHFPEIADARHAVFLKKRVAPKLASQALRNDVSEMVSGHGRIILGIVPPL